MSRRNTTDPLVRAFLDTYKINLLAIPRADADVGDVYADTDNGVSLPGRLESLLAPGFSLPAVRRGELMADIRGVKTRGIEVNVGLRLLEGFLTVIGVGGVVGRLRAAYTQQGARFIRFAIDDATRDSVDVFELGNALANQQLRKDSAFINNAYRFYAVAGVVRTSSVSIIAEDNASRTVEVEAAVLQSIEGETKLAVSRGATGELIYAGSQPLALGVELVELTYISDDSGKDRFALSAMRTPVEIRADRDIPRSFIGDPESGDIFLRITD